MAKKKAKQAKVISNRRARYDYELGDSLVAGIVLNGKETKALRLGHGHLRGSYVTLRDGELWLMNATITGTNGIPIDTYDQTRARKLLAKKREIDMLYQAKQQGRTIVPLEMLTRGRYIKIRIAAGKGRRQYDKRQVLKKREEARTINRAVKRVAHG